MSELEQVLVEETTPAEPDFQDRTYGTQEQTVGQIALYTPPDARGGLGGPSQLRPAEPMGRDVGMGPDPGPYEPITRGFESESVGAGLQDPNPVQGGYDLPATKTQVRFHGEDEDHLTHGHIKDYDHNPLADLNGYESAMADYRAEEMGFDPIDF